MSAKEKKDEPIERFEKGDIVVLDEGTMIEKEVIYYKQLAGTFTEVIGVESCKHYKVKTKRISKFIDE